MHNTDDVEMENISDKTSLLAVQGPKAALALQNLTDMNISDMKYYTFQKGTFAGKENVLISTTGYTGAGGFEIYFKNEDAEEIWNAVFEAEIPIIFYLLDWQQEILFVWKWDFVCTEMILMIQLLLLKLV